MTFFDNRRGLAVSDPPDGQHFRVLATDDGGLHWHVTGLQMPAALPGEFAFAASGQCITSHGRRAWFGTGARPGRVFPLRRSRRVLDGRADAGRERPGSAGIFALAFRGQQHGLAVGGDFLPGGVAGQLRAARATAASSWSLLRGAPAGVPLGRDVAEREHRARGRPDRQRRQHRRGHDVAALRRRQPRHRRLREPERLLGLR